MKCYQVILFFIVLLSFGFSDQPQTNPFELTHRLNLPPEVVEGNNVVSLNPFDVIRTVPPQTEAKLPSQVDSGQTVTVAPRVLDTPQKPTIKKAKILEDKQYLFILTTAILVFFSIIMTLFRSNLQRLYKAAFSPNLTKSLSEIRAEVFFVALRVWYLFFFVSFALFLYQVSNYYELIPANFGFWQWMGTLFGGIVFVVLLKHLVLTILGFAFPIHKTVKQYNFSIIVISILLGVILLPIDLLLAFGPENLKEPVIYFSILVFGLAIAFQVFRGLLIAGNFVASNKLHFFIYLCAVEIAPIMILIKLFRNYLGA